MRVGTLTSITLSMVTNCENTSTLCPRSKRASRSRSRTIFFPLASTSCSSTTGCCVRGSRGQSNRKGCEHTLPNCIYDVLKVHVIDLLHCGPTKQAQALVRRRCLVQKGTHS